MTSEHFSDTARMHRDERFMAHLGGVRSEQSTKDYLERNIAHWEAHGFGMWILRDRATSEVIGRGGLRHTEVQGVDEVGIGHAFIPQRWGAGLATEVANACVEAARDGLKLASVVAQASPENAASIRVMEKAGFLYDRHVVDQNGVALVVYRRLLSK